MRREAFAIEDHWAQSPAGDLFLRVWTPEEAKADRPTLLFFHDSLGCVDLWRDFPAALAARTGLRVLAYDRLGFGRSDPREGGLTPEFIAEEARAFVPALLERLEIRRFVALGHSVGGPMAVATAAEHPEACLAVATMAAQAFVEDRTLEGIRQAKEQFAKPGQIERLARYHGEKARWVLNAWIDTWLSAGFADWTLEPHLRRLRAPLLAIHGDQDEYGSLEHPRRIAAQSGGPAFVKIVEDCGHGPHLEKPEIVLEALAEFLSVHLPKA